MTSAKSFQGILSQLCENEDIIKISTKRPKDNQFPIEYIFVVNDINIYLLVKGESLTRGNHKWYLYETVYDEIHKTNVYVQKYIDIDILIDELKRRGRERFVNLILFNLDIFV